MEKNGVKVDGRKTRTVFYRKYQPYEATWEFKETFLKRCENELNEYRYNAMKNLMYKVGRWEKRYDRDVYDFTPSQIKGMLKEFKSTSEMSLMSQKSNLEYYLWYAKKIENQGDSNVAATINLTMDEIREFVAPIGSEARFTSRDDIYDLVTESLINYIDQSMILLIFEGFLGRANEELINLEWRNMDFQNCIIKSGDKFVQIDTQLADILEKANNENTYLLANGNTVKDGKTVKRDKVEIVDKYVSPYFLRPFVNKNKTEVQMTGSAVQRRVLNNCKMYLDRPYLTLSSIYISGLVDRGIRYTFERYDGKLMRNVDWQNFLNETGERVNIQDTYKLYKEMYEKQQEE